ncbi:MAG: type IV pilus secretin PilQ [Nitrospirae bacterium]|nr:type IV pilus secretin PilQ [Nitrospirota bacterium]
MRKKAYFIILLTALITGLMSVQSAIAEETPVLTSIDVKDNVVELKASSAFIYTMYKPSDPYLVVVELPGVGAGNISKRITSDKKGISEIKLSEIGPPTSALKVEILLESPADLVPVYQGNSLILTVKDAPILAKEPYPETMPSDVSGKETVEVLSGEPATEIQTVGFEYAEKTLRLVIKGDGKMQPAVYSFEDKIVLDIPNVSMKATLPGTVVAPIKSLRYGMHKDMVRIVVDLKEKADFNTLSEQNSIVIAFRVKEAPLGMAPAEEEISLVEKEKLPIEQRIPPKETKYEGKLINLDFQNADIVPIFRLLADMNNYNSIIHPAVSGTVTLKLINVPWDQALDIILELTNFDKQIDGNILSIAPGGFFAKRKDEERKRLEAQIKEDPLIEESVPLSYTGTAEIKTLIEEKKLLSTRGSISIHPGENTIMIRDTEKKINDVKEFIEKVDTPVPQVMIEAKIVEVSSDYSRTLGIRWSGTHTPTTKALHEVGTMNFSVNTPLTAVTGEGGVAQLSIGTGNTTTISMSLAAAEVVGKLKKLANPRVLTMNKKSASIQQGVQIPVQTTTAEGSTTVFVNANLSLNVTPTIKADTVQLEVSVNNDTPVNVGGATGINTQSVKTEAVVRDGETLVIGGIYTNSADKGEVGVPFLSKIPIIGWLFKTKTEKSTTKELLIFITPTIIKTTTLMQ